VRFKPVGYTIMKKETATMNRPYVICHMCTTIDGKILADRWRELPGGKAAGNLFESTAATFGIGAWLVGTRSAR